jgi:hypothetical protein
MVMVVQVRPGTLADAAWLAATLGAGFDVTTEPGRDPDIVVLPPELIMAERGAHPGATLIVTLSFTSSTHALVAAYEAGADVVLYNVSGWELAARVRAAARRRGVRPRPFATPGLSG